MIAPILIALLPSAVPGTQGASQVAPVPDDAGAQAPGAGASHSQAPPGFAPGDVYLFNPSVGTGGSVIRIDPVSWTTSTLLAFDVSTGLPGALAHDPYRDRLVAFGGITGSGGPQVLLYVDSAGTAVDVGLTGQYHSFAPTGDGRIYMRAVNSVSPTATLQYLDANDQLHSLLDATGTQPFELVPSPPSNFMSGMIYDPGTNALLLSSSSFVATCTGGTTSDMTVWKLPLSVDGSRVVGPVTCAQYPVDPTGIETPVGWSRRPCGDLVLVVDTNSNAQQERMLMVDPLTLAITPWAANGPYTGAAGTNAGTWSALAGKVLILDTLFDQLRAFALGETGDGTVLPTGPVAVSGGGSGEVATMIEIGGTTSTPYCTAGTSASGCQAALSSTGTASATAPSGFFLEAVAVEGNKDGLFYYAANGRQANSWGNGTSFQCVVPPVKRGGLLLGAGTNGACDGSFSQDLNARWCPSCPRPMHNPGAGAIVQAQLWYRDPLNTSNQTTSTSGAIEFPVCP